MLRTQLGMPPETNAPPRTISTNTVATAISSAPTNAPATNSAGEIIWWGERPREPFPKIASRQNSVNFRLRDQEKFQFQVRLRVGLISLGCAKNLVDAEIMLGSLLKSGVEITNDAAQADAVIVNTCSFIDSAQEESVDTILESVELRDANQRGQAVIVSGCLPQRFRDELPKLMPEVDAFMGIDQVAQVGDIVGQAVANRAEKIGEKHSNIQHPTSNIEGENRSRA